MKKLFLVLLPGLAVLSACERGDRNLNRDGFVDRSPAVGAAAESAAPNDGRQTLGKGYGRGEGERELSKSSEVDRSAGVFDNDGAGKVPDAFVIESYRALIAEDADLAVAAANTRLVVEEGGLVLRGRVATPKMSNALEDIAKKLANGREINNELDID